MKAVELDGFRGLASLRVIDAEMPRPAEQEVLIQVKAAGINFAELELTKGKYPAGRQPPFVMGFEAAGVVVECGANVTSVQVGDRVAAVASSGGFAEFATADAAMCIPIPDGVSFEKATAIPIQGSRRWLC